MGNGFDSLVLKTLELVLEDDSTFIKCLANYIYGRNLSESLQKISEGKGNIIFVLHLLYQ